MTITTKNLTVSFRGRLALDNVSLNLDPGIVGVLGPNGAGKSTLLSVLATITRPTAGTATIDGNDVSTVVGRRDARKLIGWLPQRFELSSGVTVRKTVIYAAWSNGLDAGDCPAAADEALQLVDLSARAADKVRVLSGGQRQRLGLAAALSHHPRVLLLDEPTVGLDPAQRATFRQYIRAAGVNMTVLIATHILEDVQHSCRDLVVMSNGAIAFCGNVKTLAERGATLDDTFESPLELGYQDVLSRMREGTPT